MFTQVIELTEEQVRFMRQLVERADKESYRDGRIYEFEIIDELKEKLQ